MRSSDWSSDVCSSDLGTAPARRAASRRPRPLLVAILRSLGEYRKAVGDQLYRVAPALSRVVGVLAHAARDMHQVALLGFAAALDQLAEQRHLVPMGVRHRSEEHTSELQSLMRISYAVFCLKKKTEIQIIKTT